MGRSCMSDNEVITITVLNLIIIPNEAFADIEIKVRSDKQVNHFKLRWDMKPGSSLKITENNLKPDKHLVQIIPRGENE